MAPPSGNPYARGFAADAETERALRAGLAGREATVQRGRFAAALKSLVTEPLLAVGVRRSRRRPGPGGRRQGSGRGMRVRNRAHRDRIHRHRRFHARAAPARGRRLSGQADLGRRRARGMRRGAGRSSGAHLCRACDRVRRHGRQRRLHPGRRDRTRARGRGPHGRGGRSRPRRGHARHRARREAGRRSGCPARHARARSGVRNRGTGGPR